MADTTQYTRIDPSGEAETRLRKITEQGSWLKKVIPSMGSFTCLILIGLSLRDHASKLYSRHWELSCLKLSWQSP